MPVPTAHGLPARLALAAGPLGALLAWGWGTAAGLPAEAAFVAGLTVLVAAWWIFEPVPIPLTSLLPLALLPEPPRLSRRPVGLSQAAMADSSFRR